MAGAYFLVSFILLIVIAFFAFVLVYDVWWVRLKVNSEPYRSQKHEYWDDVSVKRFGIAFLSVLLTLMALMPLIVSIPHLLVSLTIGIIAAWLLLRVTRRPRAIYYGATKLTESSMGQLLIWLRLAKFNRRARLPGS